MRLCLRKTRLRSLPKVAKVFHVTLTISVSTHCPRDVLCNRDQSIAMSFAKLSLTSILGRGVRRVYHTATGRAPYPEGFSNFFLGTHPLSAIFEGWLPRVTVATAVFLVVSGALFESHRWLSRPEAAEPGPTASVQSDPGTVQPHRRPLRSKIPRPCSRVRSSSEDSPASVVDPAPTVQANRADAAGHLRNSVSHIHCYSDRTPQPVDSAGIVLVTPGRTLLGICVEKFGTCTPELCNRFMSSTLR